MDSYCPVGEREVNMDRSTSEFLDKVRSIFREKGEPDDRIELLIEWNWEHIVSMHISREGD